MDQKKYPQPNQYRTANQQESGFMNGYFSGLENIRQKVDSVPYENFPFCCGSDNTLKKEVDMAREQNIVIQRPPPQMRMEQIQRQQTPPRALPVQSQRKPQPVVPATFWSNPVIQRYTSIKSAYSTLQSYDKNGQLVLGKMMSSHELREKNDFVIQKYDQVREELQEEANNEYKNNRDANDENYISFDQYQEMIQQINYDIAWQIFDEVNENNDVDQIIDMNCLDIMDAQAISKQKIYDLGKAIREQTVNNIEDERVLVIVCSEEHQAQQDGKNLTNAILDMVKNELEVDNYYISATRTVLVRVNQETLDNPVLRDY